MKTAKSTFQLSSPSSSGRRLASFSFSSAKHKKLLLIILWMVLAVFPLIEGLGYYLTPLTERPFTPAHETLKPSGTLGQGLGILGTLMMLFGVISYMVRKRWSFLQKFGKLRSWLTFHIFLCTLGPFYVLLHTTFKFGNIASISFWSMAIVVGSGVFGRYVYIHIPKSANGQFYSPQALKHAHNTLVKQLSEMTRLPAKDIIILTDRIGPTKSIVKALFKTIMFEIQSKKLVHKFHITLGLRGVPEPVIQKVIPMMMSNAKLQLRLRVMGPFIRAFGYWHVLHIPLALVMLAALLIHIGIAITFGYTWIF